jgi:hypothetical protein
MDNRHSVTSNLNRLCVIKVSSRLQINGDIGAVTLNHRGSGTFQQARHCFGWWTFGVLEDGVGIMFVFPLLMTLPVLYELGLKVPNFTAENLTKTGSKDRIRQERRNPTRIT